MKAVVCRRYGPPDVLKVEEVAKPVPGEDEVLVKVHATTVTSGDARVRGNVTPKGFKWMARLAFGLTGPRQPVLGVELAGVVEAVGRNVTQVKPGERVFAINGTRMGAYAEYAAVSATRALAVMPPGMSFEEAAALPFGGTTALTFFRLAKLKPGEKALIVGASGGVGTAAVQLAKHFGAEVTGVCSSANAELVKALGADRVIDYTREDFRKSGETYDVIMDTVGEESFKSCGSLLKETGRLLLVVAGIPQFIQMPWASLTSGKKVIAGAAAERSEDLRFLAELAAAGAYKVVVDRRYPLERIAEAHRYVDTGRKKGNVIVTVGQQPYLYE